VDGRTISEFMRNLFLGSRFVPRMAPPQPCKLGAQPPHPAQRS
jgi:hypothetical protein